MKRWIKASLITTACLVPIGFVVGFSTDWSHKIPISCVGSSGVKPFVEEFGNAYSRKEKKYDVTVDAGGSGFGITQIAKQYCNIGNASKDPFSVVKKEHKQDWIDNKIKTLTIGWEAICVIWIPPQNLDLSWSQLTSFLSVDEGNIEDLMRVFSGFDDGHSQVHNYGSLGEFYNSDIANPDVENKMNNEKIKPYVRAGGALTSGTAASFYHDTHLFNVNDSTLNDNQKNALDNGRYGKDRQVYDTDEANSRAWEMFHKNNVPGSMIYLSSGFVIPNLNLIKKAGYGVMAYKDQPFFSQENASLINDEYEWLRPLNIMLSLKDIKKEKDFVNYILESGDKLSKIGGKELTDSQKESMIGVGATSLEDDWMNWEDTKLAADRSADWNWEDDTAFGAQF